MTSLHGSIWRFRGEPGDLLARYDAMLGEIPASQMTFHACLRAPDGIVLVDTCASRDVFEAFRAGPFKELRERHGLPEPETVEDFPVHAALSQGERVA